MEIRVLRYFLTVVREESITKAAEVLHITQPTLSRQLAQLEENMGVKLFLRGTRKIVLTNEGILFRRRAAEILELVDKTEREMAVQENEVKGVVAIGCGDVKSVEVLTGLIRSFHEKYPFVTFEIYTATADHIQERMDRGITDIGLLVEPVDMVKYDYIRLKEQEEWVVVMHPDSPLAEKASVKAEDLRGMPLIMPNRSGMQNELANWFGEEYEKLNILFTNNLPDNSAVMVRNRLGYALVICGSASLWDDKKIICRPLEPRLTTTCVLAWKRENPFGIAAEKFIEHMRQEIQEEKR